MEDTFPDASEESDDIVEGYIQTQGFLNFHYGHLVPP